VKTCLLLASILPRKLAAQLDLLAASIWCDWGDVMRESAATKQIDGVY
jgi:hypothetical protein